MTTIKEAISTLSTLRPKYVFITAKSGAGKTYLANHLKGYKILSLDDVVLAVGKRFHIMERGGLFGIYKCKQPPRVMKAFVDLVHEFFEKHPCDPIAVEGAIGDANLIRRIFSGAYSVFTFVYLQTKNTKAYADRMMKRFKLEKKQHIRSLAIWTEITPELEAASLNSPKLKQFMMKMAKKAILGNKQRYQYFIKNRFNIYNVQV
jgi:hypothetical protein